MGDLGFEVCWQIDDVDGIEWTFLGTDTTANAESLGYESNLGVGGHFNTQFTSTDNRTRFFALLSAFLGLALVAIHNSDTKGYQSAALSQ